MSELNIETFRAWTMIAGTFDPYLVTSAHDHENGPIRGRFLKFLALPQNPNQPRKCDGSGGWACCGAESEADGTSAPGEGVVPTLPAA